MVKKTKYLKIDESKNLSEQLQEAADIIRNGGLVAFPTETVYGLGANALNAEAVKSIFAAKNRPADNPVIVHIANQNDLSRYAIEVPNIAKTLIHAFWPGPLTLVLRKSAEIPMEVTAGSETVTIRFPDHKIAQELIRLAGVPIAAPSANTSGRPSPTTAQHVLQDLDGKVDLIIDGGPTNVGVESTVLDITSQPPLLLRPGQVTFEELQAFLPDLQLLTQLTAEENVTVRSPGMKYKHYSPKSTVLLIHAHDRATFEKKVREVLSSEKHQLQKIGVLSLDELSEKFSPYQVSAKTPSKYAHILFDIFRNFEEQEVELILVQAVPATGVGRAVMDRLTRAADEEVWI